jgi:hypothetical protein
MYYIIIFTSFDITALVVQAIGGNGAAKAQSEGKATDTPTHIMVYSHNISHRLINRKQVLLSNVWEI